MRDEEIKKAWEAHSCKSGCGNNYSPTDLGPSKTHFYVGWDAAIKDVEITLYQIVGAKALAYSMKNEGRAWMDDRITQWRNAGDSVMQYVINYFREKYR